MTDQPVDVDALTRTLAEVRDRLAALETREVQDAELQTHRYNRMAEMLLRIFDHEQDDRRRLAELRATEEYEAAFAEPTPLVSVVIPTLNRVETLLNRSLPAVLGQTYPNVEVVVVGDAAPAEMGEAIAALGDPRVRFHNLTVRGPYPEDEFLRWLSSGTAPFNQGFRLARGRWIAPMADDDQMEPDALATMVALARSERLEWVYGKVRHSRPDGSVAVSGSFPPRWTFEALTAAMQASLFHAGLDFIELELAHALFEMPNDVGFARRLSVAGARMGFVDQVVVEYFPSMRGANAVAGGSRGFSGTADESMLRTHRDQLQGALNRSEARERELERRELELLTSQGELRRTLETMQSSRRWRYVESLRLAASRIRGAQG